MTSAPNQASVSVHDVPASNCVRSRIRIPFSALLIVLSPVGESSPPANSLPQGEGRRVVIVTEMAHAPRIDFTPEAHYDADSSEARQDCATYLHEGRWVCRAGKPGCPRRDCRDLSSPLRYAAGHYTPDREGLYAGRCRAGCAVSNWLS